jgi:hypothetical protein
VLSCAPSITHLTAEGRWYEACASSEGNTERRQAFARAVLADIAPALVLRAHVFDRADLERELGVPVEGKYLFAQIALVRFDAQVRSSRVRSPRVALNSIGHFGRLASAPSDDEKILLADFDRNLSWEGITELFLGEKGTPAYPDAFSHGVTDSLPVPLTRDTVGDYRKRSHEESVQGAERERNRWRRERAQRMRADPRLGPAAETLKQRLDRHEWLMMRLAPDADDGTLSMDFLAVVDGSSHQECVVNTNIEIRLPKANDLAARVDALFSAGERSLSTVEWQVR